jgi:hypothetical protein
LFCLCSFVIWICYNKFLCSILHVTFYFYVNIVSYANSEQNDKGNSIKYRLLQKGIESQARWILHPMVQPTFWHPQLHYRILEETNVKMRILRKNLTYNVNFIYCKTYMTWPIFAGLERFLDWSDRTDLLFFPSVTTLINSSIFHEIHIKKTLLDSGAYRGI